MYVPAVGRSPVFFFLFTRFPSFRHRILTRKHLYEPVHGWYNACARTCVPCRRRRRRCLSGERRVLEAGRGHAGDDGLLGNRREAFLAHTPRRYETDKKNTHKTVVVGNGFGMPRRVRNIVLLLLFIVVIYRMIIVYNNTADCPPRVGFPQVNPPPSSGRPYTRL